ncbi:twin-arginine translocation signal domain-containing protein, partial [Halomonas sp. G15]|uniref:twin-arginine translocation signal domain-containing protein n=1 Tax=Halomonas sp. G15 TaxID=2903521 RepID=UPI001E58FEA0
MSSSTLSRRVFLKGSGGVLAGTLAFAAGPISLFAPSRSWAMPLDTLSTRQGEVLLGVAKQMFPHPGLEDAVYAHVVKSLDRKSADGLMLGILHDGIVELDRSAGGDWLALNDDARLELKWTPSSRQKTSRFKLSSRPWLQLHSAALCHGPERCHVDDQS